MEQSTIIERLMSQLEQYLDFKGYEVDIDDYGVLIVEAQRGETVRISIEKVDE